MYWLRDNRIRSIYNGKSGGIRDRAVSTYFKVVRLKTLRKIKSRPRYLLGITHLILLHVTPLITFYEERKLWNSSLQKHAISYTGHTFTASLVGIHHLKPELSEILSITLLLIVPILRVRLMRLFWTSLMLDNISENAVRQKTYAIQWRMKPSSYNGWIKDRNSACRRRHTDRHIMTSVLQHDSCVSSCEERNCHSFQQFLLTAVSAMGCVSFRTHYIFSCNIQANNIWFSVV
jgi:hypothetical protein